MKPTTMYYYLVTKMMLINYMLYFNRRGVALRVGHKNSDDSCSIGEK